MLPSSVKEKKEKKKKPEHAIPVSRRFLPTPPGDSRPDLGGPGRHGGCPEPAGGSVRGARGPFRARPRHPGRPTPASLPPPRSSRPARAPGTPGAPGAPPLRPSPGAPLPTPLSHLRRSASREHLSSSPRPGRAPSAAPAGLSSRGAYGKSSFPSSPLGIRDAHPQPEATHLGSRTALPPLQTSADK